MAPIVGPSSTGRSFFRYFDIHHLFILGPSPLQDRIEGCPSPFSVVVIADPASPGLDTWVIILDCKPRLAPNPGRIGCMRVLEDNGRLESFGHFSHIGTSTSSMARRLLVFPRTGTEYIQIMTAEDHRSLSDNSQEMGTQIRDLDERSLLRQDWVGLPGPPNDFSFPDIEDGYQLCVTVVFEKHVDTDGKNLRLVFRRLDHIFREHLLDLGFGNRDERFYVRNVRSPSAIALFSYSRSDFQETPGGYQKFYFFAWWPMGPESSLKDTPSFGRAHPRRPLDNDTADRRHIASSLDLNQGLFTITNA